MDSKGYKISVIKKRLLLACH